MVGTTKGRITKLKNSAGIPLTATPAPAPPPALVQPPAQKETVSLATAALDSTQSVPASTGSAVSPQSAITSTAPAAPGLGVTGSTQGVVLPSETPVPLPPQQQQQQQQPKV